MMSTCVAPWHRLHPLVWTISTCVASSAIRRCDRLSRRSLSGTAQEFKFSELYVVSFLGQIFALNIVSKRTGLRDSLRFCKETIRVPCMSWCGRQRCPACCQSKFERSSIVSDTLNIVTASCGLYTQFSKRIEGIALDRYLSLVSDAPPAECCK